MEGTWWPVSEISSINIPVRSLLENFLKCNWLKDCIVEFAWPTTPPTLSPLSLLGNCRESRKRKDLKSIARTLPTIWASMQSQNRKTCWYGLMSTGYSATYTFPNEGCGLNRKPRKYIGSSEFFLKSAPSAGLNISPLNSCSKTCSFSIWKPNFFWSLNPLPKVFWTLFRTYPLRFHKFVPTFFSGPVEIKSSFNDIFKTTGVNNFRKCYFPGPIWNNASRQFSTKQMCCCYKYSMKRLKIVQLWITLSLLGPLLQNPAKKLNPTKKKLGDYLHFAFSVALSSGKCIQKQKSLSLVHSLLSSVKKGAIFFPRANISS